MIQRLQLQVDVRSLQTRDETAHSVDWEEAKVIERESVDGRRKIKT